MTMPPAEQDHDTDGVIFSVRRGVFMPFLYKGHQVVVHVASWTFVERILVDDEVVFRGICWGVTSTRSVEVGGDTLELTFGLRKGFSEFFLEARCHGVLIAERSHRPHSSRTGPTLRWMIALSTAAGVAFGYAVGHWLD